MRHKKYLFKAAIWRYSSEAASWYFVYLPAEIAKAIKELVLEKKIRTKGFGFVPIEARVGKSAWTTTLFPSKKGEYLLSINKKVRNEEELDEGDNVDVTITLL